MIENICLFVPFNNNNDSIHTINYVLETKAKAFQGLYAESVYKIHYVCDGNGLLHSRGKVTPVSKGDVFFTFPSFYHAIEAKDNFSYMYISFIGRKGNCLLEKFKISPNNFVVRDCGELAPFWEDGLTFPSELSDLASESVLLRSFAHLGMKAQAFNSKLINHSNAALIIKKYIDDNFSDAQFSIGRIGNELNYNKKYISTLFKKEFNIGIIDYLTTIRIQNACTMINQGLTSVSDISFSCGFTDAQYFSKVFKSKMGISPTQYIKKCD